MFLGCVWEEHRTLTSCTSFESYPEASNSIWDCQKKCEETWGCLYVGWNLRSPYCFLATHCSSFEEVDDKEMTIYKLNCAGNNFSYLPSSKIKPWTEKLFTFLSLFFERSTLCTRIVIFVGPLTD